MLRLASLVLMMPSYPRSPASSIQLWLPPPPPRAASARLESTFPRTATQSLLQHPAAVGEGARFVARRRY